MPTSIFLNYPQVVQEKEHKKEVENLWPMNKREKVKDKEKRTRINNSNIITYINNNTNTNNNNQ
jgi:hypothetical protein